MNKDFPRIITLLRKERKLSQKEAAEALGVSQALLSHYEKGIRECGLDFVVKAADYYHVTCDYLLGRTAERSFEEGELTESVPRIRSTGAGIHRRLVGSSMNIIYDLLAKAGNRRLTQNISAYLMLGIYRVFRRLYEANPENPTELFTISSPLFSGYAAAAQEKIFTDIEAMRLKNSESYIEAPSKLKLSPETIAQDYPSDAAALFNVIQQAENTLGKIKR